MFTEEELAKMMNGEINKEVEETPEANTTPSEEVVDTNVPAETTQTDTTPTETAPETNAASTTEEVEETATEEVAVTDTNKISKDDGVTVSDIILNNSDKYVKMIVMNSNVHDISNNCDVTNYIVYIDTTKNIPCVYDCQRLCVPKASVKNEDGTWKVTAIEGRRSGIIVQCGTERQLVMSKNFIYDCELNADGSINNIKEYDRKNTIKNVEVTSATDYDVAVIYVQKILPKIVKCGKYTTIETLREQVKNAYNTVYDINALFKIAELRLQLGC